MARTVAGAFASAVLAGSLVAHGRPAEAEAVLAMSIDEVRAFGEPYVLVTHLLALARTHEALGRRAVAARLFDEASDIVEAMPDPGDVRRTVQEAGRRMKRKGTRLGEELTEREIEVLGLLAAGLTAREAAKRLFVSFNTVHSHIRTIYRKLGVGSRQEAVGRAGELGVPTAAAPGRRQSPG